MTITLEEGKTKEFASNIGYDTEEGARGGVEYIDHTHVPILLTLL
jgi:outer membrane translocation and assembly module TamA